MAMLFPKGNTSRGETGRFRNITGMASNTESFPRLINRVLAYANALMQNGFKITGINLVSARNVHTEYSLFVGSSITGEIIFKEYNTTGGSRRLPVHAKWWKYSTTSNQDIIGNQKLNFRNEPCMTIIDESSVSFTSLYDKINRKMISAMVGLNETITQDSVFTVLWYCDRNDTTRNSLCSS